MEQHFLTLAEAAPGLCKTKKTLENLLGPDGQIRLGDKRLPTIKIGATRVVARIAYQALILELLQEAGVSPDAAAGLFARHPESGQEVQEVPSAPPAAPRRPGRPRKAAPGDKK